MSFDIGGAGQAHGASRVSPAAVQSAATPAVEATDADDAAEETMPSDPPAAVMDAISIAAGAYEQLRDSGRHVHFELDLSTGRLSAQLQDIDGNPLGAVGPSQVLAIASGESF